MSDQRLLLLLLAGLLATTNLACGPADSRTFDGLTVPADDPAKKPTDKQLLADELSHDVVDAEHSRALGALVMVAAEPRSLNVFDLSTRQERSIELHALPTSVSVSPDGTHAIVGHDGSLSYFQLSPLALIKKLQTTTKVFDVVLTDKFAYAFPKTGGWERIRCVDLESGEESLHVGRSVNDGTHAKLQPGTNFAYGADNGLSPSDIEKYDMSSGTASYLYDSPYHGDYAFCGNLWFSETGGRVFTSCGNVFAASSDEELDMTYVGSFGFTNKYYDRIESLAQSQALDATFVIMMSSKKGLEHDTELHRYDASHYNPAGSVDLEISQYNYGQGRFVFVRKDASAIEVLVEAKQLAAGWGVLSIPPDAWE